MHNYSAWWHLCFHVLLTMTESFLHIGYLLGSCAIWLGQSCSSHSFIHSFILYLFWIDSQVSTRHSENLIDQLLMDVYVYMMWPVNAISILVGGHKKSKNIFNMHRKCLVSLRNALNISKLSDSLESVGGSVQVLVVWLYVTSFFNGILFPYLQNGNKEV